MGPYHEAIHEHWYTYLFLNMGTAENAKEAEAWFKSDAAQDMLGRWEEFNSKKVCVMAGETRAKEGTYTIRAQDSPR